MVRTLVPGKGAGDGWSEDYICLAESDERLAPDRDYYFLFDVYKARDTISLDNISEVLVNGMPVEDVRRISDDELAVFVPVFLNEDYSTAWGISVEYSSAVVQKGGTFRFSAQVEGLLDNVSWDVIGFEDGGTRIDPTGLLTVGSSEPAQELIVLAAARENPYVYQEIPVTVTEEAPYIESIAFNERDFNCRKGEGIGLTVTVEGTAVADVTWTLTGNTSRSTYLEPGALYERESYAYLDIARDETASTLTVRAASKADSTKYADVEITVDPLTGVIKRAEILYDAALLPLDTAHTGREVTAALYDSVQSPKADNYDIESDRWILYMMEEETEHWCALYRRQEGAGSGWNAGYVSLADSDELLTPDGEYFLLFDILEVTGCFDPNALPVVTLNGTPAETVRLVEENELAAFVPVSLAGVTPLVITEQPRSVVAEKAGDTVTAKVTATGEGLSYQWYIKNPGEAEFSRSLIHKATYSTTITGASNGRELYCVVTDRYGRTAQTDTITFSIQPGQYEESGITITAQPVSARAGKVGATVTARVVAAGDGLRYQWYIRNPGEDTFKTSAIRKATYSTKITEASNGRELYCVITDQYGNTAQTDTITFTIAEPVRILRQPVNAYVRAIGNTAKLTVKAQGEGLKYQWYFRNPGETAFTKSAYKKATYTTPVTEISNGRELYCVVTDQYGNMARTDTVTMSVATDLCIITQPVDTAAAEGKTVKVTISAYGEGLRYQWYYKNPGAADFTKSAFKSTSYSTTMIPERNGREIYCVVTDINGSTVQTITVTLSMK